MTKAPLRITFVGGGIDLSCYYNSRDYGAVVSAAVNKYIYVTVNKKFDDKIRVSYSKTEIVDNVDEIEHPSVREALKTLEITLGIEIVSISDIFSRRYRAGLQQYFPGRASSRASQFKGEFASQEELAKEAVKMRGIY